MDVSESPAAATIGSRAATQAELHIVEKCRSVRSDAVWVQWLGYPKSRNCWRSASSHFPQLKGDDASLVLATHRRVKTTIAAMAEAELEGSGLVLIQGRQPIAREIRVKPAVPTIPSGPALKKQKRQHSESKVHTIRVGEASIQEIRGVRRSGSFDVEIKPVEDGGLAAAFSPRAGCLPVPGSSVRVAGSEGGEGGAGGAGGAGADGALAVGCAPQSSDLSSEGKRTNGWLRFPSDDKSELWVAHRTICEDTWRRPKGCMFRLSVSEVKDDSVTLQWIFPESTPGDASAWVGLWDASSACPPAPRARRRPLALPTRARRRPLALPTRARRRRSLFP